MDFTLTVPLGPRTFAVGPGENDDNIAFYVDGNHIGGARLVNGVEVALVASPVAQGSGVQLTDGRVTLHTPSGEV
jgi:hypothetical protein